MWTYIKKGQRWFIVLLGAVSAALTMMSMLLAWTQNTYNYVTGLQGRYFLPVVGILLLVVRNGKLVQASKDKTAVVRGAVLMNILVCGFVLLSVFVQ